MNLDELLYDPLTLQIVQRCTGEWRTDEPGVEQWRSGQADYTLRDYLTAQGQTVQLPAQAVQAISPETAAGLLHDLRADPAWQQTLLAELADPRHVSLLRASTDEEFMAGLAELSGSTSPDTLRRQMDALEGHARQAARLLDAGIAPPFPGPGDQATGQTTSKVSPALQALAWLAQAAQGASTVAGEPPEPTRLALLKIDIPAPQLDFSEERLRLVLQRTEPGPDKP